MAIRHAERISSNSRETSDVRNLLEHSDIHRLKNGRGGIDSCRNKHAFFFTRGDLPQFVRNLIDLHLSVQLHPSTTTLACQRMSSCFTSYRCLVIPFTSALNVCTEPLTGSPYSNPVSFQ